MKTRVLLTTLCGALTLCADVVPDAPPEDPRETAKREAWMSAVLIISLLEQGDNAAFPGIRAWLEDFHLIAATTPPPESGKPFPPLDADALVTRNPNFWTACYEVQPGDPGLTLLHAALLLSGGEAQRASVIATLGLQRPAIPEDIKRGLVSVIAHCQSAQAHSSELVRLGIKLHDVRAYDSALKKFEEAIAEWPANGRAYYERGSTLRMKAIADSRFVVRESTGEEPEAPHDPPETMQSFARARRHDPLHLLAYQGEDPAMLDGLMALVRSGTAVWEAMRKRPEQPIKIAQLRDFSEACRAASIDDFALALRQLVVASNRHYSTADRDLITESLGRLAPAALTPPLLARIGGETKLPARQIVVPLVVPPPEIAQTTEAEPPSKAVKKKDPPAASKSKGKSGRNSKSATASSKAKRKVAEKSSPAKKKASSKSKKRKG
jgi:tetratricopeptide (TPR) repeat protein